MIPKFSAGDGLELKKKHPCGSSLFSVIFAGSDVKIRCDGCGREVVLPRVKLEKMIRQVHEKEND